MNSDLITILLHKRGVTDVADIERFLSPDYERDTHDPFLFFGMDKAVARVFDAMEKGERIAVYADYDCDGIPGASVLSDFFKKIGYENFEVYLPHRDREGYGYHLPALDELATRGVKLVITVDVGTKAHAGVLHANSLGIDTIVTDHHEISGELPAAYAILNPKMAPYPFPHLCGAAVAWKLVQALLIEGRKRNLPNFIAIPEGWEKWLLDLVAIATVADLVPLIGENRTLAYWGLKVLHKTPRKGIVALCNQLRLSRITIDETDIAFSFAPRINAASRMDSPELALRMLTTDSQIEAEQLVSQLESLNAKRKGVVAGIVKEAKKRARSRGEPGDLVTVLGDPDWKPSLCGLAANSVMEERGGVVLLWGRDAFGKIKGSARSDGSMSVVELFAKAGDAFEEYGGHHASGGFTVATEHVHTLQQVLAAAAAQIAKGHPLPEAKDAPLHDAILTLREISSTLLKEISRLAPFGMGNLKPIFRISQTRILNVKRFGKEKNHTEVSLGCAASGATQCAFQFFKAPEDFTRIPTPDILVDVLATIERDTFRGPDRIALRIQDIL